MRVIRSHPQDGYNLLKQIGFLGPALEVPLITMKSGTVPDIRSV